jgi:hypothetical protein
MISSSPLTPMLILLLTHDRGSTLQVPDTLLLESSVQPKAATVSSLLLSWILANEQLGVKPYQVRAVVLDLACIGAMTAYPRPRRHMYKLRVICCWWRAHFANCHHR